MILGPCDRQRDKGNQGTRDIQTKESMVEGKNKEQRTRKEPGNLLQMLAATVAESVDPEALGPLPQSTMESSHKSKWKVARWTLTFPESNRWFSTSMSVPSKCTCLRCKTKARRTAGAN